MSTLVRRVVRPWVALVCALAAVLAWLAVATTSWGDGTLTANGVQCTDSNFELDELSPSIYSANRLRLTQILMLQRRASDLNLNKDEALWDEKSRLPGAREFSEWTTQEFKQGTRHQNGSTLWPTAEDPDYLYERTQRLLKYDVYDRESLRATAHLRCMGQFHPTAGNNALSTHGLYVKECITLLRAEEAADPTLGKRISGDGGTEVDPLSTAASKDDKPWVDALQRFYTCIDGDCTQLRGIPWAPATGAIILAARAVVPRVSQVDRPTFPIQQANPGTELNALQRNIDACVNATFYVSPTHDLMRHSVDEVVDDHFSVCVDTASFALDQPVQVLLSTPSAQQIEWLWPGEAKELHFEMSRKTSAQVVHMTIAGFPRRDLLRALARQPGGPLEKKDIFDFVNSVKKNDEQGDAGISKSVVPDSGGVSIRSFARELLLADALAPPAEVRTAEDARKALDKAWPGATEKTLNDVKKKASAVRLAFVDLSKRQLPDERALIEKLLPLQTDINGAHTLDELRPSVDKLTGFPEQVGKLAAAEAKPQPVVHTVTLDNNETHEVADKLCQLAAEAVPLVSEDVLIRGRTAAGTSRDTYVLEYDFAGGFQAASPEELTDEQGVFVIVRNVPAGWSASVGVDGKAVAQRDLTIVGLSSTAGTAPSQADLTSGTSQQRFGFRSVRPLDREMQPPSTQVLYLGHLDSGHRYAVTVCASSTGSTDCATQGGEPSSGTATALKKDPSKGSGSGSAGSGSGSSSGNGSSSGSGSGSHAGSEDDVRVSVSPTRRTIATNSVTVHSRRHFGIRAGFGAVTSFGGFQDLSSVQGLGPNAVVVRQRSWDGEFALPLLVTYYARARDTIDMPTGLNGGIVGGLDVLSIGPNPRMYLGGVFDVWGLGFTGAFSYERTSFVSNAPGTVLPSASAAQNDSVWRPGFSLSLTTDLDIFEAVTQKYFNPPKFPTTATGGAH